MKPCRSCDCQIPDSARLCPHCRAKHKRSDWGPQALLVSVSGAVAIGVLLESCPDLAARTALWTEDRPPATAVATAVAPSFRQIEGGTIPSGALPTIARLKYEGGGDWYANPSSLPNLLTAIRERTGIRVASRPAEVGLTDPDLADYPYLYMTGHGNFRLSDEGLERLGRYLQTGGFLHADDNYGLDESFRREIERVFPDRPLVEVPLDHPVYSIFYELPDGLPKVHEHDGLAAQGFGIFIGGRLALFYSYQSDLGDGWEDAGVHDDTDEVREQALQMGVNLFLYALTSGPER